MKLITPEQFLLPYNKSIGNTKTSLRTGGNYTANHNMCSHHRSKQLFMKVEIQHLVKMKSNMMWTFELRMGV